MLYSPDAVFTTATYLYSTYLYSQMLYSPQQYMISCVHRAIFLFPGKGKGFQEEQRKVYVDELSFPRRHVPAPHPEEKEVFVSGLRTDIAEADIWKVLCALGCSDVGEILLLKDPDQGDMSRGKFKGWTAAKFLFVRVLLCPCQQRGGACCTSALNCSPGRNQSKFISAPFTGDAHHHIHILFS